MTKTAKKGLLVATAIGSVVGTGVTLLYTTKKGKSLRKDASDTVNTLSSGVNSLIGSAEKKLKKVGKEGKKIELSASSVAKKVKKSAAKKKKK